MSQEYHNKVIILGSAEKRLDVVSYALVVTPPNWDWVGITLNDQAGMGTDSGRTVLDFYSKGFPLGLGELSTRFPGITFECNLLDITYPLLHCVTLVDGREIASRTEAVTWTGEEEEAEELTTDINSKGDKK